MSILIIDRARSLYKESLDYAKLFEIVEKLKSCLHTSTYYAYRDEIIEYIYKCLYKGYLIKYLNSDLYDEEIYERIIYNANQLENRKDKDKFLSLDQLTNRVLLLVNQVRNIFEDVNRFKEKLICELENNSLEDERVKVYNYIKDKKEKLQTIHFDKVFLDESDGEVKFIPDLQERLKEKIEEVDKSLNKVIDDSETQANLRFLASYSAKFDRERYNLPYAPLLELENDEAHVYVLHSPIKDEFRSFAFSFLNDQPNDFIYIDCKRIEELSKDDIMRLFVIVSNHHFNLIVENITEVKKKTQELLYTQFLDVGKKGLYVFIEDYTSNDDIYNKFMEIIRNNRGVYKSLDVSKKYLSMPIYDELIDLFISKGLVSDKTTREAKIVKKDMQLIGFFGMNDILKFHLHSRDWIDYGRKLNFMNNNGMVNDFIRNLPNLSLFIDSSWEPTFKVIERPTSNRFKFDYDALKELNPRNLEKIINLNADMYAKVGLLIDYCLLHFDDIQLSWDQISKEEMEERLTLAVRCVYALYGIDIEPTVEIVTRIKDNDSIKGICIDGGKKILFKKKACEDYDEIVQTVAHETFHSLQYKAITSPYSDWYFNEFGITKHRIEQWRINNSCYYLSMNQYDYKYYRHQIYEADAFAFMKDCLQSYNPYRTEIDFE